MPIAPVAAPPLVEVACGVHFSGINLDPLVIGWYWRARFERYPRRELHPALIESGKFRVAPGLVPVRAWLLSRDGEYLVQLQHDRIVLNWRKQQATYPRFDVVRRRAMEEFESFVSFCAKELRQAPKFEQAELVKVNHLIESQHWQSTDDLAEAIPATKALLGTPGMAKPKLSFQLHSDTGDGGYSAVVGAMHARGSEHSIFSLELRSRVSFQGGLRELEAALVDQNERVNGLFATLMPDEQRIRRFGGAE